MYNVLIKAFVAAYALMYYNTQMYHYGYKANEALDGADSTANNWVKSMYYKDIFMPVVNNGGKDSCFVKKVFGFEINELNITMTLGSMKKNSSQRTGSAVTALVVACRQYRPCRKIYGNMANKQTLYTDATNAVTLAMRQMLELLSNTYVDAVKMCPNYGGILSYGMGWNGFVGAYKLGLPDVLQAGHYGQLAQTDLYNITGMGKIRDMMDVMSFLELDAWPQFSALLNYGLNVGLNWTTTPMRKFNTYSDTGRPIKHGDYYGDVVKGVKEDCVAVAKGAVDSNCGLAKAICKSYDECTTFNKAGVDLTCIEFGLSVGIVCAGGSLVSVVGTVAAPIAATICGIGGKTICSVALDAASFNCDHDKAACKAANAKCYDSGKIFADCLHSCDGQCCQIPNYYCTTPKTAVMCAQ